MPFLIRNTVRKEGTDVIWERFEAASPEVEALGRTQFETNGAG
jgi:hypothetical protein